MTSSGNKFWEKILVRQIKRNFLLGHTVLSINFCLDQKIICDISEILIEDISIKNVFRLLLYNENLLDY